MKHVTQVSMQTATRVLPQGTQSLRSFEFPGDPKTVPCPDERERSQAAAWYWSVTLAVVIWSVSYLIRQPGIVTTTLAQPFSPLGDFALEGMLLALAWLGLILAACVALLTGAARFEE